MNKNARIFVLVGVFVGLLIFNAIPFHKGYDLSCHPGMEVVRIQAGSYGFPLADIHDTSHLGSDCYLLVNGHETFNHDSKYYDNYHVITAGFIVDAGLAVVVLAAVAYLMRSRKTET